MGVYLRAKFEVSSIILTSFRQGVILPPHSTSKRTPKKSTQIRVKTFISSCMWISYEIISDTKCQQNFYPLLRNAVKWSDTL